MEAKMHAIWSEYWCGLQCLCCSVCSSYKTFHFGLNGSCRVLLGSLVIATPKASIELRLNFDLEWDSWIGFIARK